MGKLSPAVLEVLRVRAQGNTEQQCARILGKSVYTIKQQLRIAREVLHAEDTCHAVYIAFCLWPAEVTTA